MVKPQCGRSLTASAKDQFVKGLSVTGAQIEEIHLNKMKLEHCRACGNGWGTCNKTGACVIRDDFAEIYGTLKEADGIVWISAVYPPTSRSRRRKRTP